MIAIYPNRPRFFASKFCRLMTKVCLATEVGPEGVVLLMVIVHLEDSKRYSGPALFFNNQLFPLVGLKNVYALRRIRERLVGRGWLHYEESTKQSPGKYWVLIPDYAAHFLDTTPEERSVECTLVQENAGKNSNQNPIYDKNVGQFSNQNELATQNDGENSNQNPPGIPTCDKDVGNFSNQNPPGIQNAGKNSNHHFSQNENAGKNSNQNKFATQDDGENSNQKALHITYPIENQNPNTNAREKEKPDQKENQTQPAQPAESAKPSGLSPQAIYDLVGSVADVVAGKKTGDAIRRGESSVLNPDVPPPPPVRPRGYHPSDYPEEFPKAKRIAKLYDQEVGSEYGSASGIPEIIRRIVEGETVEALEQTVRNAGAHFKKLETPKDRRPGAKSFFAPGGRYDDYRDAHLGKEKPIPEWVVRKMKSDALEALEKKRREEEEACIAQCAAEGLCPPREHLKTLKTSWERMRMKADVYAPLILERLGEFKPQV